MTKKTITSATLLLAGVLLGLILSYFYFQSLSISFTGFNGPALTPSNGSPIDWERDGKRFVKDFSDEVDQPTKLDKRKILNWDRRAVGWKIDAKLLRKLLNHEVVIGLDTIYAVDTVLVEIGLRPDELMPSKKANTIIVSGYNSRNIPGSIPEIMNHKKYQKDSLINPDVQPEYVYRLVDFSPDSSRYANQPASIEYVGPCNSCP